MEKRWWKYYIWKRRRDTTKTKILDGIEVGENEEYKNYGDKILDGFKKFTDELEYKKYDDILDEI